MTWKLPSATTATTVASGFATDAASGLGARLSQALSPWRKALAVHDPAKVVLVLAVTLALGGDCLADVAVLRGELGLFGSVASDRRSRARLRRWLRTLRPRWRRSTTARAVARAQAWRLAGAHAPDRGYGFHPLCAFVDHGADGIGEPLAVLLRPGNAGSNTAADHIAVIRQALAQLPGHRPGTRAGRKVLVRADAAGCTHDVLAWMAGQRLSYSVGFPLPHITAALVQLIPAGVWTPAYDAHDEIRDGAWVAELTGLMDLSGWAPGMRVIVLKERPHPGAQLRITDVDGHRITGFATNTKTGGPGTQLADLELRQRRRARVEDRIRVAKDTGLMNLPLHGFDQNRIWCAIVALAVELTAWMQMLALHGHDARRWEPKRLRLRLFTVPATIARTGRRIALHLASKAPWANLVRDGLRRLSPLAVPG